MADDAWREYVLSVTENDSQVAIRQKTGIDQGTISRWLSPERTRSALTADTARRFATAYGRPMLEVLVNADVLSEEEAGIKAGPVPTLSGASDSALAKEALRWVTELARRVTEGSERQQGQ